MKKCYKCGEAKSESEFYTDNSRGDKLTRRCKKCEKVFYQEKRQRNKENYKTRDRRYYLKNAEKIREKNRVWALKNKHKISAHHKVKSALYKGIIAKGVCEFCGDINTVAHHDDYSKPLVVRWLCPIHHMRLHHKSQSLASPEKKLNNE